MTPCSCFSATRIGGSVLLFGGDKLSTNDSFFNAQTTVQNKILPQQELPQVWMSGPSKIKKKSDLYLELYNTNYLTLTGAAWYTYFYDHIGTSTVRARYSQTQRTASTSGRRVGIRSHHTHRTVGKIFPSASRKGSHTYTACSVQRDWAWHYTRISPGT